MKILRSSATIFGVLKSLRALMSRFYSGRFGSALLKAPATTNTDLIARRPQS
jgi:hypothetical protein